MEILIAVVILLVIGIWYGAFRPIETLAKMADDEVQVYSAERKAENIKTLAKLKITDDSVNNAKANLVKLRAIEL